MPKLNVKDAQLLTGVAGANPAVVLAQVKDGNVELGELSMVDTTTMTDSTKTQVAGVRDSMGGSVTVVWDPGAATHATLMTSYLAKTKIALGFDLRTNAPASIVKYYGDGYVTNCSAPIAVSGGNGAMECTFNFKLSGPYTKVAA